MKQQIKYIKINDKEIPINIRNYKTAKSVKIFFKGNVLNITKPKRLSNQNLMKILEQNREDIYNKYEKILSSKVNSVKQWQTGEKIFYFGKELTIFREYSKKQKIELEINQTEEKLIIMIPQDINDNDIKPNVDRAIKRFLKINTEEIINKRLPYWSKVTGLEYNTVSVRDATSRYGSCVPSKKNVYFSSRLSMLPNEEIDAIIVHELCHMVYKNHNEQFYGLVERYIPNYKELDKWLKQNGNMIMF